MLGTKRRGRRKGVVVREGSVAQARREAGLTLAEVARGEVSRTAIHLVEKGLARPSMETLEHIAHQTGKPMSFFLQSPDEPSALFADLKDLQKAKSYLAKALAAGQPKHEPSVQAEVRMLVGQVEEWCGNSANADEQFETAIRILEQLNAPELLRDAHMAYAELLEARQDIPAAAHHWKLAAEICRLAAALGSNGELRTNTTRSLTA
jgi:transcriptional regulator with XRE-family HTH domain